MAKHRAPGGGRKPKGEFKGKSAAFSTRITPQLRAALDEEAAHGGMSLSQIVERRLRDSFDRPKRTELALGPAHIRALAYSAARIAVHIELGTGKHWNEDQFTNEALSAALELLLGPYFSPRNGAVVPDRVIAHVDSLKQAGGSGQYAEMMKIPREFGVQKASEFFGAIEYLEMTGDPAQWAYYNSELEEFLREESLLKFIVQNLRKGAKT